MKYLHKKIHPIVDTPMWMKEGYKEMRLKIIYPTHKGNPKAMGATVPYVLPYLAAITPKGIDVELVNMLRERIDYNDVPDIAAISVKTPMADESYMIADRFRKRAQRLC